MHLQVVGWQMWLVVFEFTHEVGHLVLGFLFVLLLKLCESLFTDVEFFFCAFDWTGKQKNDKDDFLISGNLFVE